MQIPRAVNLWPPVTVDQAVGDVDECGILHDRGGVQYPRNGRPVLVAAATNRSAVALLGDVAAFDDNVGAAGPDQLDGSQRLVARLRA